MKKLISNVIGLSLGSADDAQKDINKVKKPNLPTPFTSSLLTQHDAIRLILSFLPPSQFINFLITSKQVYKTTYQDDAFWNLMFFAHFKKIDAELLTEQDHSNASLSSSIPHNSKLLDNPRIAYKLHHLYSTIRFDPSWKLDDLLLFDASSPNKVTNSGSVKFAPSRLANPLKIFIGVDYAFKLIHYELEVLFTGNHSAGWTLLGLAAKEALPSAGKYYSYLGCYTKDHFNVGLADNGYLSCKSAGNFGIGFGHNSLVKMVAKFDTETNKHSVQFFVRNAQKMEEQTKSETITFELKNGENEIYPVVNLNEHTGAEIKRAVYKEQPKSSWTSFF